MEEITAYDIIWDHYVIEWNLKGDRSRRVQGVFYPDGCKNPLLALDELRKRAHLCLVEALYE